MLDRSRIEAPQFPPAWGRLRASWAAAIGLAAALGAAYFLATRLSLTLLTTSDGVAAFWPAAGIAAGTMVALGSAARVPVAVGVMAATMLAGLTGDRIGLPAAVVFAMCNAGEALLIAWLIERHHGSGFSLDTLPRVLGFFLATGISTAASGVAAAAAFAIFHITDAPVVTTWLHWLASDTFGVMAVAPLAIGIVHSLRNPPDLAQVAEGACSLAVLAVASVFCFGWPTSNWFTILPLAMLLPLFVWPAARCPPVFAATAVFILAVVIAASVTFGVGRLGNAAVPLSDRLFAAQSALMAISACALVVAALFAERRSREALLSASNERLRAQEGAFRRLLGALPAAIYTTDRAGYITYCNQAAVELWGRRPQLGKDKWSDLWRLHYPDGTSVPLDERPTQIVLNEGRAVRGREALLERPDGTLVPIMPCPAPLIDERGSVIGVVNMQIDITERKRAEAVLKESEGCLADALAAGQVIAFEWDATTGQSRRSANAALILGFEEGDGDPGPRRDNFFPRVHPDDRRLLKARMRDLRPGNPSYALSFRFRRPDGRQLWLEETAKGEFDAAGRLLRIKGLTRDITDRKKAELALDERNMQLALAGRAALVGSFSLRFRNGGGPGLGRFRSPPPLARGNPTHDAQYMEGQRASRGSTRDWTSCGTAPSANGDTNTASSIVRSDPRAMFGGSRRAVSSRTAATAARSGWWASTSTSPRASGRRSTSACWWPSSTTASRTFSPPSAPSPRAPRTRAYPGRTSPRRWPAAFSQWRRRTSS